MCACAHVGGAYSGRARLQVGGAVSDHHHRLEAVLLLQNADDLSLAAALGGGLALVKAGVLAWKTSGGRARQGSGGRVPREVAWRHALTVEVELEPVCVDVMLRDVELGGHVLDDAAEASRDEEHLHVTLVQRIHQLPGEKMKITARFFVCNRCSVRELLKVLGANLT